MIISARKFCLLCVVSLSLLLMASSASAATWTVKNTANEYPSGAAIGACTIVLLDTTQQHGDVILQPGESYSWTSGNNGKSPLFYVMGTCEERPALFQFSSGYKVLTSRRCDGLDVTGRIDLPKPPCTAQEIKLKICPKEGVTWGFCPQ